MSEAAPISPVHVIDSIRVLQDEYTQHDINLERIMSPSKPYAGGGTSKKALKRRKAEPVPPSSLLACIKTQFEASSCVFGISAGTDASGTGVADFADTAASALTETEITCKLIVLYLCISFCQRHVGFRAELFRSGGFCDCVRRVC